MRWGVIAGGGASLSAGAGGVGNIHGHRVIDLDTFFGATFERSLGVLGGLYNEGDSFYTSVVAVVGAGILGGLYNESDTFFGAIVALVNPTTFDATDHSANITFSGGNRTVSYSGTTTDAAARMSSYKTTGDWYFEVTVNNTLTGGDTGVGFARGDATLSNIANIASLSFIVFKSGNIWSNGSNTTKNVGTISNGTQIGILAKIGAGKGYARILPTGNWNGDPTADPNTNTGGLTLAATSGGFTPAATFGGSGGTNVPNNYTFNVGQSTFVGTIPTGANTVWT